MSPGCRPCAFGHVGDGNVHYNVMQPVGADRQAFLALWDEVRDVVHAIVIDMNGSISAEHGVGRLKREEIKQYKSPIEIDLMHRVKAALDPHNIMNPGKVV